MKNVFLKSLPLVLIWFAGNLFTAFSSQAQVVAGPTDKQLQDINKFMAPYRKKVTDILEADKTGEYKIYLADLKAAAAAKDPAEQKRLAEKLNNDHYAFIKKSWDRAVINHEEMRAGVARILGHNNFEMNEFGGIHSIDLGLVVTLPLRFTAELVCPFEVNEGESNQTLVANCQASAASCHTIVSADSEFDGGCHVKASTGDKFDLPAGTFTKITVSAQCDADGWGFAYALGGYAKAEAKIGVRLQGPGYNQLVIVKDIWCVAPVIWFSTYEFNAPNYQAQAAFNGSFAGGNTFTAQVYTEARAISVPLLEGCTGDCETESYDFIKVLATN